MTEINAYMNGYSIGDIKFLEASVEAHQEALKESKFETETAKEFLYQHIQTNKELEKEVDRLQTKENEFWIPQLERIQVENELNEKTLEVMDKQRIQMEEIHEETFKGSKLILEQFIKSQQKAERLEKVLKDVREEATCKHVEPYIILRIIDRALETEAKA
ncbi:hypothetical protein [Fictibacillus sp. 18YEL24]|uniref:hypothetical protein n=1 Tax=Fictibacillus sp. 18YEL24 TaxID=2745875 RepID=UPI0018CDF5A5|nr:hypothetical protein [Fictibacillus sp. 18YEL24]MBH0171046.1 hypothetical protein [Fictibacillus sp. 18YEL24]